MLTDFLLVWQYRTCPVFVQKLKIVVLGLVRREFRRSLGVLTIGSPSMGREFRRLALQQTWRFHCPGHTGRVRYSYRTCPVWITRNQRLVFKSLEGREFRRESGVPTVGSSDVSHFNCLGGFNVLVIPDVSGIHTGRVRYGRPEANG